MSNLSHSREGAYSQFLGNERLIHTLFILSNRLPRLCGPEISLALRLVCCFFCKPEAMLSVASHTLGVHT
jgi:hypothetical protein